MCAGRGASTSSRVGLETRSIKQKLQIAAREREREREQEHADQKLEIETQGVTRGDPRCPKGYRGGARTVRYGGRRRTCVSCPRLPGTATQRPASGTLTALGKARRTAFIVSSKLTGPSAPRSRALVVKHNCDARTVTARPERRDCCPPSHPLLGPLARWPLAAGRVPWTFADEFTSVRIRSATALLSVQSPPSTIQS